MAEKRMFAKSIVLSDAFLDMPMSARCLYFTLGMLADDDGFVGNPKSIMRQCGSTDDDMKVLLAKRYVLGFESGVIVIKHWRINNYLKNDRHKDTTYVEEMRELTIDDKGAYTEKDRLDTKWIQGGDTDKNSIDKNSIDKNIKHQYGTYKNVLLSDEELEKLKNEFPDWEERIERVSEYCASKGKAYRNYLATIRAWSKKDNAGKRGDIIPVYDTSKNPEFNEDEFNRIMATRNKKPDIIPTYDTSKNPPFDEEAYNRRMNERKNK